MVTEYLDGVTLAQLLRPQHQLDFPRALQIFQQLLAAIDAAHRGHVVHRDLKPENIMVLQVAPAEDFVKVLDFGIAKIAEPELTTLTLDDDVFGTPVYMAPEQIQGSHAATTLTDLYACATILFEMLTGVPPFFGDSVKAILTSQLLDAIPPVSARSIVGDLPGELDAVFARALAKDPRQRYQDARELRDALAVALQYEPETQTRCSTCRRSNSSPLDFCRAGCPVRPAAAAVERPVAAPQAVAPPKPFTTEDAADGQAILGRVDELALIRELFDGPHPDVVEIIGPIGLGRTTMLAAADRMAREAGYRVLHASPDPWLSHRPWHPVRQLVGQALALDGRHGLDTLRMNALRAGLAVEDVTGLARLFRNSEDSAGIEEGSRFAEASHSALRALIHRRGSGKQCLILDDVNKYDGASIAFLQRLCRQLTNRQTKVIIAADASPLPLDGHHASVYLCELPDAVTAVLAERTAARLGVTIPTGALGETLRSAAGNPLYVEHAMRLLAEGGSRRDGDNDRTLAALIRSRLDRLPKVARELLEAISAIGSEAPAAILDALGAVTDDGTLALLEDRGLTAATADGSLGLAHPLIGDIAHREMTRDRRHALHRRAIELLRMRDVGPFVLARHAVEAGLSELALELCERAGDRACQLGDDQVAGLIHYRTAQKVARWELLIGEDDDRYLKLAEKLGRSLRRAGHLLPGEMVLKEAISSAARHPGQRVRLRHELARLHRAGGAAELAMETFQSAIEEATAAGDRDEVVAMHVELGRVLRDRGDDARALETLESVLELTTSSADDAVAPPRGSWRLLLDLATGYRERQDHTRALSFAEAALRAARQEDSAQGQAHAYLMLGTLQTLTKRVDLANASFSSASSLFDQLGDRRRTAEALLARSRQDPTSRAALARRARALCEQIGWHQGAEQARTLEHAAAVFSRAARVKPV
jgi:tetratricopeptide (TPR) repeat protein